MEQNFRNRPENGDGSIMLEQALMVVKWQPIGTSPFEGEKTAPWSWNDCKGKAAPWDENYVLVDVNGKVGAAFYESYPTQVRRGVYRATGWRWLHECGDCTYGKEIFPTHWMPYPPPVDSISGERAKEEA